MKGLLDALNSGDPALNQGLIQFGLSLLSSKGNLGNAIGQAGQQGLAGALGVRDRQAQQKRMGLQDQLTQGQLTAQQQQQAEWKRAQELRDLPQQFVTPAMKPDTMDNRDVGAPGESPVLPGFDQSGYLNALKVKDFGEYMRTSKAMLGEQKTPEVKAFSPGQVVGVVDGGKFTPQYTVPQEQKAAELPSAVREYQFAKGEGYKGTFEQWDTARKRAGASSVNVPINMGQKGFDNTLKLRGDFRSEPVYKAHQEMQSAYAQIGQALKQASPAGDLAGATKIMKLLDPGSVVRESELGMAMAASGLLDRVQNYASNIINGTKLTPTQRKDFQTLADALYRESVKQYDTKRAEYEGIASRNGLNTLDVLGQPQGGAASNPAGMPTGSGGKNDPLGIR